MYRILFITDDLARKKPLKSELMAGNYSVVTASSREVFDEGFAPQRIDIVVLDFERCATEPMRLCSALRREERLRDAPLVALVTEDQLGRIDLGSGLEDYLTLPVSGKRLLERLRFLMWKRHKVDKKSGFAHGDLVVDCNCYEVTLSGRPLDLTYKEFELLKFLVAHPGRVFSREVLLDKVWGYDFYGGTRTVDVHIRRLRSKIEQGASVYIETVRNVGYKFIGPAGN